MEALNKIKKSFMLNILALAGVGVGLGNVAMSWTLFGVTQNADIWMASLLIVQALSVISLLGVEQAAIFLAEEYEKNEENGNNFYYNLLCWSIAYGATLALIIGIFIDNIITLFSSGYELSVRDNIHSVLIPLLMQVACSPILYVFRVNLLLKGKARLSIVINYLIPFIQLFSLTIFWLIEINNQIYISYSIGIICGILTLILININADLTVIIKSFDFGKLKPLIKASFNLRITHSLHNLLVLILTSSALSNSGSGALAMFQYVKKIADGITSASVGPHAQVYHSEQTINWVRKAEHQFTQNVKNYAIHTTIILFIYYILTIIIIGLLYYLGFKKFNNISTDLLILFTGLVIWQYIISIETIAVGIIVLMKKSSLIFFINLIFIINYYLILHFIFDSPYGLNQIMVSCIMSQLISLILFTVSSKAIFKRKFN